MESGENSTSTTPPAYTLVSQEMWWINPENACCPVLDDRLGKVTLKVGPTGEEIVANLQFIMMGSPYFNNIIKKDNLSQPILLRELDPAAVYLILPFLYTGSIQIKDDHVRILLLAATKFQIREIQTYCLESLIAGLNYQNYWDVMGFARNNGLQSLSDKCDEFLFENFKPLIECVEFLELGFPEVHWIFTVIQNNHFQPVVKSMDILNALINWGNYKVDERTQYFHPLAKEINLIEIVETHSLSALKNALMGGDSPLKNCEKCKDLYTIVLESIIEKSQSSDPIIITVRVEEPDMDMIKVEEDCEIVYDSGCDVSSVVSPGIQPEPSPIPLGQFEQESNRLRRIRNYSIRIVFSLRLLFCHFRVGHKLYLDDVMKRGMYPVTNAVTKKLPWNLIHDLPAEVPARIVDIKYQSNPRLVSLKLGIVNWEESEGIWRYINNVAYHNFPGMEEFIVLRQRYDRSLKNSWKAGDRFRSLSGTEWRLGTISATTPFNKEFPTSNFLCHEMKLDFIENIDGRISPWNIEKIPQGFGTQKSFKDGIPATEDELESVVAYKPNKRDWRRDSRDVECIRISTILENVMKLEIAQPFLNPVDLIHYPEYSNIAEYFVDLSVIKARVQNHFYRRVEAIEFDIKKIYSNAVQFNESSPDILKNARMVRDVCLKTISQPGVTEIKSAFKAVSGAIWSNSEEVGNEDQLNSSAVKRKRSQTKANPKAKRRRTVKRKF